MAKTEDGNNSKIDNFQHDMHIKKTILKVIFMTASFRPNFLTNILNEGEVKYRVLCSCSRATQLW